MKAAPKLYRACALLALALLGALLLAACGTPTEAEPTPTTAPTMTAQSEPTPTIESAQPPVAQSSPTAVSEPAGATPAVAAASNLKFDFRIQLYQGQGALGGQEIKFSDLFGEGKPVILNFWAGLCPPCRLEMPDFDRFASEHESKVLLFGLDVGTFTGLGSTEDGQALLRELGISYPAGSTPDSSVIARYEVFGMPTTLFLKPDGTVFSSWTGILTQEKLTELAEELIEASAE